MRCWIFAGLLVLLGCESGAVCGEGTVEMNGACLPLGDAECGVGTVLDPATMACISDTTCGLGTVRNPETGECESESVTCGMGTTRNAETGACEATLECATGTIELEGTCVPDGSVICADGTIFNAASGTCEAGDVCGEGTILLDGTCRPSDEALIGDVTAGAEPDDPAFGGTPTGFAAPTVGETLTLEGCITPDDYDADGSIDYDADWFEFSVDGPGQYRINADGLGGAAAGFAIVGNDAPLAGAWIRIGLNLVGDSSERRVYLPSAGSYSLVVFDSRSLVDLATLDTDAYGAVVGLDGPPPMRPVGGEDTCYFVTFEAEAPPIPTPFAGGSTSGTLGAPTYLSVPTSARTIFQALLSEESAAADATVDLVSDVAALSVAIGAGEDLGFSAPVASGSPLLAVVDAVVDWGLDPVAWDMEVSIVPELVDGDVSLTNAASPLFFLAGLSMTAGEVVHVQLGLSAPASVVILRPDLSDSTSICETCGSTDFYYRAEQTGVHIIQLIDPGAEQGASLELTSTLTRQAALRVEPGTPLVVPLADERTFFEIDTSALVWSRTEFQNFMGTLTELELGLHPLTAGILEQPTNGGGCGLDYDCDYAGIDASLPGTSDRVSLVEGTTLGQRLLVELRDPTGFDGDESVEVAFGPEEFVELAPVVGTPATRAGDAIPAGGPRYYFVRGLRGGNVGFDVVGTGGTDPSIELIDSNTQPILVEDANSGADSEESLTRRMTEAWFAYAVRADAGAGSADITVTLEAPPYTESVGTSVFTSICPSRAGSGVREPLVVDRPGFGSDEDLSTVQSFATFSGFEFFGVPVTGLIASSNGWMTFDTSYSGGPGFAPQPIPTAGGADSLIAPFWRDLILEELCFEERATRFTAEFRGVGIGFTGGGGFIVGDVEFQVLLHADSSIEFVYGPAHDLATTGSLGMTASVGLESADGLIGLSPGATIEGGTSILWTPTP